MGSLLVHPCPKFTPFAVTLDTVDSELQHYQTSERMIAERRCVFDDPEVVQKPAVRDVGF